jgi:hypothetical protein
MDDASAKATSDRTWLTIGATWLVLCLYQLMLGWPQVANDAFLDADDMLRLVQVRDLLAGQGWFDLHQYRIDPPAGTPMHWSRLVDLPIAMVILLLQPILGQAAAETVALVAVPLLTMGVLVLAIGTVAARAFSGRPSALRIVVLACLFCGLSPLLSVQFRLTRIDHHGWQAVVIAMAAAALLFKKPGKGPALAGLALAAGLSISIELLPVTASFGAILVLRWLIDPSQRWQLVQFMVALAASLALLFIATHGLADLTAWCDAIAPAHLAFLAAAAAGTSAIALIPRAQGVLLVGLLALIGVAALAIFGTFAPVCLGSPFGQLDPLVREYWYLKVLEGRPFWEQQPLAAIVLLAQTLAGLAAAAYLWRRAPAAHRQHWLEYVVLLAAALIGGMLVWRSMALAGALAAVPLAWLADMLLGQVFSTRRLPWRLLMAAALTVLLQPVVLVGLLKPMMPKALAPIVPAAVSSDTCSINRNARLLATLPSQTIFAPLDVGPALLVQTSHSPIATGHHRANLAMRDVIVAFTSPPEQARGIVAAHGAGLLVLCTDLIEAKNYARSAPDGLMAQLIAGRAPSWLQPVDVKGPGSLRVYRVVR